jgi:tRNA threonylcarbamoyl adenosine modification protein (Sua5/YciO/YrdC/YwlC family)
MAELLSIDPRSPGAEDIARAAELLRQGEVIAIPTDTFYGLAANPFDVTAVEKIFAIKGRPKNNPLLLLVDSVEMAEGLAADLPPLFRRCAERFWPGPLTIVVKASPKLPSALTAHTGTIGLRHPAAPIALSLIRAAGCPITATSANRTGDPDSSTASQVQCSLGERLPLILDGGASLAEKPSTVLSLNGELWEILREGGISSLEIAAFFENAT